MARWKPSYFQAQDIAAQRLISAHPDEYQRLLQQARAELPEEPCGSCAYLVQQGASPVWVGGDAV
jgi:hypothetical protein